MANKRKRLQPSILLVEDDPVTREQLEDLLRERSQRLYIAENGERGLSIYAEAWPDVVITDILMPAMNGVEMARRIRKLDPAAQIIGITAYSEMEDFGDTKQDIVRYVLKPLDLDELFKAVDQCAQKILAKKKELPRPD
jgi:YesN/AraC family two-component response regulator